MSGRKHGKKKRLKNSFRNDGSFMEMFRQMQGLDEDGGGQSEGDSLSNIPMPGSAVNMHDDQPPQHTTSQPPTRDSDCRTSYEDLTDQDSHGHEVMHDKDNRFQQESQSNVTRDDHVDMSDATACIGSYTSTVSSSPHILIGKRKITSKRGVLKTGIVKKLKVEDKFSGFSSATSTSNDTSRSRYMSEVDKYKTHCEGDKKAVPALVK